jgi:hypothetical protein
VGARLTIAVLALFVLLLPATVRAVSDRTSTLVDSACTAQQTRATWVSFLGSFTQGNYATLDALFAQQPNFGWYSSNLPGLRRTTAARNRGTLIQYFRSRHLKGDRLRLASFTYNGNGMFPPIRGIRGHTAPELLRGRFTRTGWHPEGHSS